MGDIQPLLIAGKEVIGTYKAIRDYVVFTYKRVITVNVQEMTGALVPGGKQNNIFTQAADRRLVIRSESCGKDDAYEYI